MDINQERQLAYQYASAAFDLSLEKGVEENVYAELMDIGEVLSQNSELKNLLTSPFIKPAKQTLSVKRIFGGYVDELVMGLLAVMIKNRRISIFKSLTQEYEKLYERHLGVTRITVTTSQPLSDERRNKLLARLEKSCGGKVHLETLVDPSIIGGIIIEQDDILIDHSVRNFLTEISARIASSG